MSTAAQINYDVKSLELAELGKKRIEWANQSMKVLQIIRKEFIKNQPLKGIRISACLHVTAERTWCCARRIRFRRRTMFRRAWCATRAFRFSPSRAKTTTLITSTFLR